MAYTGFISYARNDMATSGGGPLLKFLEDLEYEAKLRCGTKNTVLFRDEKSIQLGDEWTEGIPAVLQECRILLCVLSPSWLNSVPCQKELRDFEGKGGHIIPIRWLEVPREQLPEAIQRRQDSNAGLPESYRNGELRRLCEGAGADYRAVVEYLAKRIAELADRPAAPAPPRGGPRAVKLAVVAATRKELVAAETAWKNRMREEGADPEGALSVALPAGCYGEEQWEWAPFQGEHVREVLMLAKEVALSEEFQPLDVQVLQGDLRNLIEAEAQKNQLVLLIIDPLTLALEQYRSWVSGLEPPPGIHHLNKNSGAIIVLTPTMEQYQPALDNLVAESLPNMSGFGAKVLIHEVYFENPASFKQSLKALLNTLKEQVARQGAAKRALPPWLQRPSITNTPSTGG